MQNIDVDIDDEDMAIRLLYPLLPSYKHFRDTLLYGKDDLILQDVKDALTHRDLVDNKLVNKLIILLKLMFWLLMVEKILAKIKSSTIVI